MLYYYGYKFESTRAERNGIFTSALRRVRVTSTQWYSVSDISGAIVSRHAVCSWIIYITMRLLRYCYLRNGKKITVSRAATLNHTPVFTLFTHDKIDFMNYVPTHTSDIASSSFLAYALDGRRYCIGTRFFGPSLLRCRYGRKDFVNRAKRIDNRIDDKSKR